ncbi:hypothetical protein CVT26_009150 [Gymnopilus dilepis]|uniref:F-box domain-containing protein n=1 Tax=Gymnopilus dilepis TaxID=231916 RepID=A0A409Y975_9AGAR|nr:hypothetical protein CVT26_009150 [Gymnopilus dilepis]
MHPANLDRVTLHQIFSNLTITSENREEWCRNTMEDSPLITVRNGSQVCSSWRKVITADPMLWGRSMDLNILHAVTNEWRAEVERRAGQSSRLHIQVFLGQNKDLVEFTKAFLSEYWPRIQLLSIEYENLPYAAWMESAWQEGRIWEIFRRPSPNLIYFSVECANCPALEFVNNFPMFKDEAPMLRYFAATIFRLNAQATWLSRLQRLRFTSAFSALELLRILDQMPLLEALGIYDNDQNYYTTNYAYEDGEGEGHEGRDDVEDDEEERNDHEGDEDHPPDDEAPSQKCEMVDLPCVVLPLLSYISIDIGRLASSFAKYIDILDHITPASDCTLVLGGRARVEANPANVETARRILRTYFESFLKGQSPTSATLLIMDTAIHIGMSSPGRKFSFNLEFTANIPQAGSFLDALSIARAFTMVKEFILAIEPESNILKSMNITAAVAMFSSLDALESLRASPSTLQYVLSLPLKPNQAGPFPSLKNLSLIHISKSDGLDDYILHLFFEHMKPKFGFGALDFCLDLVASAETLKCDLSFLERYNGLKVIWGERRLWARRKEQIYLCGSGNPGILNFNSKVV